MEFVDVVECDPIGRRFPDSFCRRVVRSTRDPYVLAHELGRAVGDLEHDDNPEDLMHPDSGHDGLTDEQLDEVADASRRWGSADESQVGL